MTTATPDLTTRTFDIQSPVLVAPARYPARTPYIPPTDFEIEALAETLNGSTGFSWLWATLFGWIYYAVHGLWLWAFLSLITANFLVVGSLFLVYVGWRRDARKRAQKILTTQAIYQASANVRG